MLSSLSGSKHLLSTESAVYWIHPTLCTTAAAVSGTGQLGLPVCETEQAQLSVIGQSVW